jgi:hypothetical protein
MEELIVDDVDSQTAIARELGEDEETAIAQEQDELINAENAALTTTKPETTFEMMLKAIGESLSDLPRSDEWEDTEDKDYDQDDSQLAKLSEDDKLGRVMRTISNPVHNRMRCFRRST